MNLLIGKPVCHKLAFNSPQSNFSPNVFTDAKLMFFLLVLEHCMHIFVILWNNILFFSLFYLLKSEPYEDKHDQMVAEVYQYSVYFALFGALLLRASVVGRPLI